MILLLTLIQLLMHHNIVHSILCTEEAEFVTAISDISDSVLIVFNKNNNKGETNRVDMLKYEIEADTEALEEELVINKDLMELNSDEQLSMSLSTAGVLTNVFTTISMTQFLFTGALPHSTLLVIIIVPVLSVIFIILIIIMFCLYWRRKKAVQGISEK